MKKVQIIIGSTRKARVGKKVADWILGEAKKQHPEIAFELVDLAEVNLPFFDETNHPVMQQYEHDHTKSWSQLIASADGYLMLTSEYNYTAAPALINAIDFLHNEWHDKPVGLIAYGGAVGGARAIEQLKLLVLAVWLQPLHATLPITGVANFIKDEAFEPIPELTKALGAMLDELAAKLT